MTTKIKEIDEPIYDVAVECERLFEAQIARFTQASNGNGAALITDLSDQFSIWANSMRVFDNGNLSLDRKLQDHALIQDQVLRGLDLMRANLAYAHLTDVSSERNEAEGSGLTHPPRLSIENVEAVSEALKRLPQIKTLIRHSSTKNHARRAREHTAELNLSSFTRLASLSLKSLYSTASAELLEHLTISMTDTYRLFLYRRDKEGPRKPPPQPKPFGLATIPEVSLDEETSKDAMPRTMLSRDMTADAPQVFQMTHHRPLAPQSSPTTIDSREAASRIDKLRSCPTHRSAASVLVSYAEYPKPNDSLSTCDWCYKTLPKDIFQGHKWQEHVDEDHRPFVCISEKCIKSLYLQRFATCRKWLQHMDAHSAEWHRQVYAFQWRCPLCDDNTIKFFNPENLKEHFENKHHDVGLKESQKDTIVRMSRVYYPRPRNECPLCCLPIGDEKSLQGTIEGDEDMKNAPDQISRTENKAKRLEIHTSQQTVPSIGESDPKASSSATILAPEIIAQHVSGHLRTIMLITLRIMAIDGPVEVSPDMESVSGNTDEELSRVTSTHDDPGEKGDILALTSNLGELAEGYQLEDLEKAVPELDEMVTWHFVLGEEDTPIDNVSHQAGEQSALPSHSDEHMEEAAETLFTSSNLERIPLNQNEQDRSDDEETYVIVESGMPGSPSRKHRTRHASKGPSSAPRQVTPPLSFLFIVNKLLISEPERDNYFSHIPPRTPKMYTGEVPSKVMRYSNGQVSEAFRYHWYRDSSHAMGDLLCLDSSGNYIQNPSTGSYHIAQQYKTFAVFACNPLLPVMVTGKDPLVHKTDDWELLRIFHPRDNPGFSQVGTLDSPLGDGGAPVRYVAGKSPSWMPALIPETYQSPMRHCPPSHGLGGELGIILGLMALTVEVDRDGNSEVNNTFIERQEWRGNQWRGPKTPRGHPPTAEDDPNGFLSVVFLDPENPGSTEESLRWFEWHTPIVRELSVK